MIPDAVGMYGKNKIHMCLISAKSRVLIAISLMLETFATGIKIESSYQNPCLRADQGIKVTSKLQKSKDQDTWLQFDL